MKKSRRPLTKVKNPEPKVGSQSWVVWAAWADRIILLQEGQYKYNGTPQDILTPSILEEVYGIRCLVLQHPKTGRPIITIDRD